MFRLGNQALMYGSNYRHLHVLVLVVLRTCVLVSEGKHQIFLLVAGHSWLI